MKFVNLATILFSVMFLAGCSYAEKFEHSDEYKSAKPSIKEITVPENLSSKNVENYYPVPTIDANNVGSSKVTVLPPGSSLIKK